MAELVHDFFLHVILSRIFLSDKILRGMQKWVQLNFIVLPDWITWLPECRIGNCVPSEFAARNLREFCKRSRACGAGSEIRAPGLLLEIEWNIQGDWNSSARLCIRPILMILKKLIRKHFNNYKAVQ